MKKAGGPVAQAHRRLATQQILLPGEEKAGTRGVILHAALELFAEHGFGGTSVRDIAKTAGVQPATMYAHFPSKQHVLAEIVKIGHDEHQRHLRAALLEGAADPAEQLAGLVRAHVRFHADFSMLAVVANAELHALLPEFAAAALELRHQSEQMLLDLIQRGIRQRVFRVAQPKLALNAIGGMGVRVAHWYTPAYELSAKQVADHYAQMALRIVGVAAAS